MKLILEQSLQLISIKNEKESNEMPTSDCAFLRIVVSPFFSMMLFCQAEPKVALCGMFYYTQ